MDFKDSLDNSRLKEYAACPQLYDYKYNYALGDESGYAARFSSVMIHDPIEQWYKYNGNYAPDWQLLMKAWAPNQAEILADKFTSYTIGKAAALYK